MKQKFSFSMFIAVIAGLVLVSCSFKPREITDNILIERDTLDICGSQFVHTSIDSHFYSLTNLIGDTLLKDDARMFFKVDFKDFNRDGCDDIFINVFSGNDGQTELHLFNGGRFHKLQDVHDSPVLIDSTKLYYSYEQIGCSDNLWESYLSSIDEWKSTDLAVIEGNECDTIKGMIAIYRLTPDGEPKELIDEFNPDVLRQYDNSKWRFIEAYWKKNYKQFQSLQ